MTDVTARPRADGPGVRELLPGDLALGEAGDGFKTLLGSCVCVILTDPRRTVGALCHIVHVGAPPAAERHNTAYGEVALEEMFLRLDARGYVPGRCQAFVYGGGNMFPDHGPWHGVGSRNTCWVLHHLQEHSIEILDCAVGGNGYRRVSWRVGAGDPSVEMVLVPSGGMDAH